MVTSVGCWSRDTAVTVSQTAVRVRRPERRRPEGASRRRGTTSTGGGGSTRSEARDSTTLHTPGDSSVKIKQLSSVPRIGVDFS